MTIRRRRRGHPKARRSATPPVARVKPDRPEFFIRIPWLREAGIPVTAESSISVSAVYGCCRLIVDSLAPAPVRVYRIESGGRREVLHDDPVAYTLNWGAPVDLEPDALPAQSVEEALLWSSLLWGNGYAEVQRDGAGRFFALWPLEPERVTPRRDGWRFWYEIQQPEGGVVELAAKDVFHLRGPGLFGWVGDSTVYRAGKAIGISGAAQDFAGAYFANGTVLSGILSSDKIVTKAQADRAREEWNLIHGRGAARQHGIGVTGQGLKFQPINHDAQQSQLVESRRFQVAEIARFFGVPLTLLADNEAWTNLSELYQGFYRNALLPWKERFDSEATRKCFPQRQPWREVEHDLTRLTLGTFKDLVAGLRDAVEGGLKTRNEARSILGDNAVGPEGDVLVVTGSLKPLEQVLAEPEPEPPAEEPEDEAEDDAEPEDGQGESEDDSEAEDGQGESEDGEDETVAAPMNGSSMAHVAVALDRFARRLANRRIDLERRAPAKAEESLAAERKRLEPDLVAECRRALGSCMTTPDSEMRILAVAEAVLQGEPAPLAAARLTREVTA